MKKAASLILAIFIFCSLALTVNAEVFNGDDLFTVDLPEGFEQSATSTSDFYFTNEKDDTFTISYSDNTQKGGIFSPADMSKKEIEEYTSSLSEEAETVMKDYSDSFELRFLAGEKVKHKNGKTALVCKTKTTITKNKKTAVYYQTMYEFGGKDYKYTFTYTTSDKGEKDSFDSVFESINISEKETETNLDRIKGLALALGVVLLILIGIVRFIRTPEKRAKGKIK